MIFEDRKELLYSQTHVYWDEVFIDYDNGKHRGQARQSSHKRHTIPHPYGRAMGCPL